MATKNILEFPQISSLGSGDAIYVVQGGQDRHIEFHDFEDSIVLDATQITNTTFDDITNTVLQDTLEELNNKINQVTLSVNADEVQVTPAGTISSTDVQSALEELDTDIQATTATADSALQNVVEDTTPQLGGELDAQSNKIVNLADPTANQDAATKVYVDNQLATQDQASEISVSPAGTISSTDVQNALEELDTDIQAITVPVDSVFGRTGAVTAQSGDYNASQVTVTPAGNISSTDTQSALEELDTELQATTSTADSALQNVVEDTTPQLGGNLDVQSNEIINVSKIAGDLASPNNIAISFSINAAVFENADGGENTLIITQDSDPVNHWRINSSATGNAPVLEVRGSDTNIDLELKTKGSGAITVEGITDYENNVTADDHIPNKKFCDDTYLQNVVEDTTPQLGGNLDAQGNEINNAVLDDFGIQHTTASSSSGTLTLDYETAQSFEVTLTEDITGITINNWPASGTLGELVVAFVQDSVDRTITYSSEYKFQGGTAHTMSTGSGAVDIVTFRTYDSGTTVRCDFGQDYS